MNQQTYHKLISGRSRNFSASLLRALLRVISWLYLAGVTLRNFLYSTGWIKTLCVKAAVISIGNITAGGTGKTPLVIWLCNLISKKRISCAILTRGYKSGQNSRLSTANCIDEPAIIAEHCPQAAVVIDPDRPAGAAYAIDNLDAKVLIMDDGFQHRRLARDLDIVTIDATCPFGYGRLLPAGLLREPVTSLKRAQAVVITRCDQVADADLAQLQHQINQINPNITIATSLHCPVCARPAQGNDLTLDELKKSKVFALCGIGNPDAFFNTLKALGLKVLASRTYNDHHHYGTGDIAYIRETARIINANLVLTTEKDWTKISHLLPKTTDLTFACLRIELKFLTGQDNLRALIQDTIAGKMSQRTEN